MDEHILAIENEVIDQYLNDDNPRPWIIAFSGGKDSTALTQIVWNSLKQIDPARRTRPVHIVCNNTLVENPTILDYVKKQINLIKSAAIEQSLPVTFEHTIPSLNNSFWVNMIGRGYVAPNSLFRWCTERLKINPTTKYILDQISRYGEVIILLGSRKAESITRATSIKKFEIKGERLSKYQINGAYLFSPIKELTTEEVWFYLAGNESPWHADNSELAHIYRNASDNNDCPLITDTSMPTCGGSRFGCWVCTVVKNDRSMRGLIQSGENWMLPLLNMRNFLAQTIDRDNPEYDPEIYRMPVRRNMDKGIGPYWPKWRYEILRQLLITQATIQKERPEISLITQQELVIIQTVWNRDFIFEYRVSDILDEVYGKHNIPKYKEWTNDEHALLKEACSNNQSDFELINNLLKARHNKLILTNNRGLQKDLERILDEYLFPTYTDVYKQNNNK